MDSKHPAPDEQPVGRPDDLEENPGIGQSKGLFGRAGAKDADRLEGENTVEGDVENNADAAGAVHPDLGRTND